MHFWEVDFSFCFSLLEKMRIVLIRSKLTEQGSALATTKLDFLKAFILSVNLLLS